MLAGANRFTFRSLVCVAAALVGLAVFAIGVTIWNLRTDAINDANSEIGNIASVLAEQTARSVQSIDIIANEVREKLESSAAKGRDNFERLARGRAMHQMLVDRLEHLSQAEVIAFLNREGQIVASSRNWPAPSANFSDRRYFQHFLKADDRSLYISKLLLNRITGMQTIFFSKRVSGEGNEFLGIVLVGVNLSYFQQIYNSLSSVREQSIQLFRNDGTLLVRHPRPDEHIGDKLPANSIWYALASQGGGPYRAVDEDGGGPRLIAVRPVRDYPLVVNVGVRERAALANWANRATSIAIGTLFALLCFVVLLRATINQFRRLAASEASLAAGKAILAEKTRELEGANMRADAALNNMTQGLCMFDSSERLVICNDRYLTMFNLSPEIVKPGCPLTELVEYRESLGQMKDDTGEYISSLREQLGQGKSIYSTMHISDGRVIAVASQPIAGGGWVATHEDITERKRAELQIAHMAHHDSLTDLANRVLFREQMEKALSDLRQNGKQFSVFVFDLDLFKSVNNSLGHPVGDTLLKTVAQRLREIVRDTDTIGRIGGDEFAILQIVDRNQKRETIMLANRLLKAISAPYKIDGHRIVIGTSVGIAMAPDDGTDAEQLLKNADLALYRAKSEGRNDYRFFEPQMDAEARLRRALEVDLRNALAGQEFELHYQKIIDIQSKEACGVEALIRWRHPDHGLIGPNRFIPLAEDIGQIIPLGDWILRKACADAAAWPEHIKLAINLSPVQFKNEKLVASVARAIADAGISPGRVELEVTESVLLHQSEGNLSVLHQLKQLGISIVLDDFGTGYSSLSYLRIFPFDKIKIDSSFVAELSNRSDCTAIVSAVTSLGRTLDITTTAEGVETEEQFTLLRAAGCTQAQGYLFSRPEPASALNFPRRREKDAKEKVA